MTTVTTVDTTEIRRAIALLAEPDAVVELRAPKVYGRGRTASGYYSDWDALVRDASALSGNVSSVYVTMNSVASSLLSRRTNRHERYAENTTADHDITARRWILIDFDAVRPAGISSSDDEHESAVERAREGWRWLVARGVPETALAAVDSGNGAHLLLRVDLPNDEAATVLVRRVLQAVAFALDDERVVIDQSVFNAARIVKLPGTLTAKGDSTPERPHRIARILCAPEAVAVCPRDVIERIADLTPEEPQQARFQNPSTGGDFDLDRWMAEHGLDVGEPRTWKDGRRWIFAVCPWNADHTDRSAYLVQHGNGAIAAGCHHNGCQGRAWADLRELYEPGYRNRRNGASGSVGAKSAESPDGGGDTAHIALTAQSNDWPAPMEEEAFYGLAGDVVRAVSPVTEADDAALLLQFLAMFGNAAGRAPHFMVEADRHGLNVNVCIVGPTGKARKGTSHGRVREFFAAVDLDWVAARIVHGLSSGEGLIWAVRDEIRKTEAVRDPKTKEVLDYQEVTVDPGVDDKRLYVVEAEFASTLRVMQRDGNTLSPVLRQAWDSGDLRTMTKNSPAHATGAHISIIGHITEEELRRYLDRTEMANGLANRFIWACAKRSKMLPEGGGEIEGKAALVRRLHDALSFASDLAGPMVKDDAARDMWAAAYPALSEGKPGLAGAMLARGEAQAMRLAALYAALDCSPWIGEEHLKAALAVWDYAVASVEYLFGTSLGDPLADEIMRMLREAQDGITRSQIRDFLGRHKSSEEIGRALGALERLSLARCETEDTGGRPAERWYAMR